MPESAKTYEICDKLACYALSIPALFADLVRIMLPDEALGFIDLDRVKVEPARHLVEDGKDVISYVVASLEGVSDDGPGTLLLIIAVEHKSSHDRATLAKMTDYMRSAFERYSKDAWVLAVLLYHGRRGKRTDPLARVATTPGMPVASPDDSRFISDATTIYCRKYRGVVAALLWDTTGSHAGLASR